MMISSCKYRDVCLVVPYYVLHATRKLYVMLLNDLIRPRKKQYDCIDYFGFCVISNVKMLTTLKVVQTTF